MKKLKAIIYADQRYHCADGKTAHGLVRYSQRFKIVGVIDTALSPSDAGVLLDGIHRNIPLFNDLKEAYENTEPNIFIIGAVSEGGMLPQGYHSAVEWALHHGLHIVSGLHEFLSDNTSFQRLAKKHGCTITDVRKLFQNKKRFYTGDIKNVRSLRIALLGTDSAIGKRTLAVLLTEELKKRGRKADMIFTGQTGWLQGWPYGIVLDAMINDFVSGGIEGAILDSWAHEHPDFMFIEGQGSLVHPFFPGGFEILAAGQVHGFLLVHAPKRQHLDGFPEYPMPSPNRVVNIAELLTEKKLLGIGINPENMNQNDIISSKKKLIDEFHVPVIEPITEGVALIADVLERVYDK